MMDERDVEVVLQPQAEVAESPRWDDREGCLWWVDIHGSLLHRFDPAGRGDRSWPMDRPLGSVALLSGGGLLLTLADRVVAFDPEAGSQDLVASVDVTGTRLNDSGCDPAGRLWVGSMVETGPPASGSLYRLEQGGLQPVVAGVSISNGLDWSPDGSTLYYVDSAAGGVDAFDYDSAAGTLGRRWRLIEVPPAEGLADGLTVDSEGHLWVAICDGCEVRRYTPEGRHELTLRLPVSRVTSCAFGGDDLTDLYITSARRRLSPAQLLEQPLAGSIFRVRPGVQGRPTRRCLLEAGA